MITERGIVVRTRNDSDRNFRCTETRILFSIYIISESLELYQTMWRKK
jgi:hypothetical protein